MTNTTQPTAAELAALVADLNAIIAEQEARLRSQESQISEMYTEIVKMKGQAEVSDAAIADLAETNYKLGGVIADLRYALKNAERKAATSLANNLCPDHRDKQEGKPCLACEIERLRELLDRCDVVMDTSAMHGLPQSLPPVYKDSWAMVHGQVREELRKGSRQFPACEPALGTDRCERCGSDLATMRASGEPCPAVEARWVVQ